MNTGYIFNFKDHGAFSPDGKVADSMPQAEIDAHNRKLAQEQIEAMKATGRVVLYLSRKDIPASPGGKAMELKAQIVSTWEGSQWFRVVGSRTSRNNFGAQRTDVWFRFNCSVWHGVNIGDNDIVRCKRTKGSR